MNEWINKCFIWISENEGPLRCKTILWITRNVMSHHYYIRKMHKFYILLHISHWLNLLVIYAFEGIFHCCVHQNFGRSGQLMSEITLMIWSSVTATPWTCIRDVLGLNPGRELDNAYRSFHVYSHSLQQISGHYLQEASTAFFQILSNSSFIHYPTIWR
jgi:hypothetical protein